MRRVLAIASLFILLVSGAMGQQRQLLKDFQSPGAEWRGKPFWAWNGELNKEELLRQVGVMKEMGFGGFFMHSRTGLATEYLGDKWFEMINACADEAERLGMEAWLYDEDRWPSGSAGGLATVEEKYRMKYLRLTTVAAKDFVWPEEVVAVFSCNLDGLNYTDGKRLSKDTLDSDIEGKTILVFTTETMLPASFYNGNTYLDTMNREAVDHFIQITHERYKAMCGDRLGKSIKGIFTDEPHRGMVMCKNVSNNEGHDPANVVPWTPGLFEKFQARFGYDLVEKLPEVFLRPNGERIVKTKWDYMEHIQTLFLDNWAKPMQEWCRENNMIMTGHVLHEDSLGSQAVPNGSLMRYYEYMDYPGVDVLTEGNKNYWIVKQLSSAARQLGQKWLLSELYGCTGWQMQFQGQKDAGAWQSLLGINVRCHHLSWFSMEGEAKRDYPGSFLHQSSWHKDYDLVETYFSRMHVMLGHGKPVCDLLLVNPVESAWAQIHVGWATWLSAVAPEVTRLDRMYQQMFQWLSGSQLDFDYGDEDHIARMSKVIETPDGPVFQLGQAQYRAVMVSGVETIRSTTLDALEAFHKAGGTVIFAGEAPGWVNAERSGRAVTLAKKTLAVDFAQAGVLKACLGAVTRPIEILDAKGQTVTEVFCQARRAANDSILMALNMNRTKAYDDVTVRIAGEGFVQEWDLMNGKRLRIPARSVDGAMEFTADFAPSGVRAYMLAKKANASLPIAPKYEEAERVVLDGPYDYTLDEPNICVLDFAQFKLDDGKWEGPLETLKVDHAIRARLGLAQRGGEMLQPWFVKQQKPTEKAKIALRFAFDIDSMPEGNLCLLVERPDVLSVSINDEALPASSAKGWMLDPTFRRLPVPKKALKQGENVVELRGGFHEAVNLENLFLVGDFGVWVEGTKRSLVDLPKQLRAGSVTDQGLPFYSGRIRYALPLEKKAGKNQRLFLESPGFEGAYWQVFRGEQASGMAAWAPYEVDVTDMARGEGTVELEVVLTRRNTFGPLHQVPLKTAAYSPNSFVTGGAAFSEPYMLYPAGLLESPVLVTRKNVAGE